MYFSTLTANIRTRRGSKVAINLPVFFDENTPRPFIDPTIPWDRDIYPEDPGGCSLQCQKTESTLNKYVRGQKRCCSPRPHIFGRNGLWDGL